MKHHQRMVLPDKILSKRAWPQPVIFLLLAGNAVAGELEEPRGYNIMLEEIVVTAQQREESSMNTPVAVNAFTAQDIVNTGAVSIQDISDYIPGVEIGGSNGTSTQTGITIRGVSSPNISSGGDPSTATFYDGAYMPRAVATVPFVDISRVEILKGPQGTLFGRNTTAGVINILPNAPGQEFESFIQVRAGNYNLQRFEGMLNVPVNDSFALRGNLFSTRRDGTINNVGVGPDPGDANIQTARISALYTPSDSTSFQFGYDVEDRAEAPRMAIGVGKYAWEQSVDPFSGGTNHDVDGAEETREMQAVSLKVKHAFNANWSVYGISSYRDWDTTNLEEEDGTPEPRRYLDTNNIEQSDIWYSEVRVHFVNDNLDVIMGGNYSQEELFQRTDVHVTADSYMQFVSLGAGLGIDEHLWDMLGTDEATYMFLSANDGVAVLPPSFAGSYITEIMDNTGEFTNWGVFADVTYQLTDTIRLAGGLRYSFDDKEYSWQTNEKDVDWPYQPPALVYDPAVTSEDPSLWYNQYSSSDDWSKVTGRAVVDWQFTDTAMTYLSVTTGYKSGGFDGQSFDSWAAGPFEPEEILNIELGLKADFFDSRLRIDGSIFRSDLDNKQSTASTKDGPDDPTAQPRVISSDEKTQGAEIIVTWSIVDSLRLAGSTTYRETDADVQAYFNSMGEPAGGNSTSKADTDYTIRLDWTPAIATGFLLLHLDYVFDENNALNENTVIYVPGPWYFKDKKQLNARVSWKNETETVELALWGQNLLNEKHASNPGGFVADTFGAAHTTTDDLLTWGVDLRYNFY